MPRRPATSRPAMAISWCAVALCSVASHMKLQRLDDERMRRRIDADFATDANDGTAEPGELQPAAAFEVFEQRRFHLRRQVRIRPLDAVGHRGWKIDPLRLRHRRTFPGRG